MIRLPNNSKADRKLARQLERYAAQDTGRCAPSEKIAVPDPAKAWHKDAMSPEGAKEAFKALMGYEPDEVIVRDEWIYAGPIKREEGHA